MMPSQNRRAPQPSVKKRREAGQKKPNLEDFIESRDYSGAIALLEFERKSGQEDDTVLLWLGYAAFHLGDYNKALDVYQTVLRGPDPDPTVHTYAACCLFYLGLYGDAEEEALKGPASRLQTRLLFHIAHKFNDENKLMVYHQKLPDSTEDQLSFASVHYLRSHFQEATDIYKRLLLENRDYLALNVYVALCYYQLDYYDVSLEILGVYLQVHPESAIAVNLQACNHFRLYNGRPAENKLKVLLDRSNSYESDLIRHNLVVFRNGENALQVLPPLLDVIPEAKLNLVIYYLENDEVKEAYDLIQDLEPMAPQEYILKAVVNASLGQQAGSADHLKVAQQYFQLVGASASECDTIPGRQCMASCFFLLKQFEDVLIYLNSIQTYFTDNETFNYNFGIAKAATGQYREAEQHLLMVNSDKIRNDYCYQSWLARCHIMNQKPRLAWELYLKMDTSNESFALLQLIANDCYRMGQFYFSAKAFDVLERLDPNPEYWEGKRGACVGVMQMIIAGREPQDSLRDVITMLRNTSNPQVEYIIRVMRRWAKDNNIKV